MSRTRSKTSPQRRGHYLLWSYSTFHPLGPLNLTFNQMPFAENLPASFNLWNLQHIIREEKKGSRLEASLVISLLIQFYKGQMQ